LRKTRGGRFWGGGRGIQVNGKGMTFLVGLKEEKKIIQQVK
jgi:hypothetical protein